METVINFSIQSPDFESALESALDVTRKAVGNIDADIGVRVSAGSVARRTDDEVTLWNWHCEGIIIPVNVSTFLT